MFDEATVRAVGRIAARTKTEPAVWLAVAEVESAGRVSAVVAGKNEPLIRFEGHYFDRRLTGEKRARARREAKPPPGLTTLGSSRHPAGGIKKAHPQR